MKIGRLRKAMAEADAALAEHPDVVMVGIGEKFSGGENRRIDAIIVYVKRKGAPRGPLIDDPIRLPSGEYRTDIREMSPEALRLLNWNLDGADLIYSADSDRSGTLAFVSIEEGPRRRAFGITNAHVVGPPDVSARGGKIWARSTAGWLEIGTVFAHTLLRSGGPKNPPDVALIELNDDGIDFAKAYVIERWPGDPIKGIDGLSASPFAGSRFQHAYASKADGTMREVRADPIFEVSGRPMKDLDPQTGATKLIAFKRVFYAPVASTVLPGHSGAALTRKRASDNARVVSGLVVGGGAGSLFAFSFADVYAHIRDDFGIIL